MLSNKDTENIPLVWINLKRETKRRQRMKWAITQGGWNDHRFNFVALPNIFKGGSEYTGIYKRTELEPSRRTSRKELACLTSWKLALSKAKEIQTSSGWILLMEDDVGSSLATPESWAHTLIDIIEYCPENTMAIQLAPISAIAKKELFRIWKESKGECLAINKKKVRSHGNGAILIRQTAIKYLTDPFLKISRCLTKDKLLLVHPWKIRAVADKWLYGSLPEESCQVATYPHFCLDAENSSVHKDHVNEFHKPSREITIGIWKNDNRKDLIKSQEKWDAIANVKGQGKRQE